MIGEAVRENYRRQGEARERERIIAMLEMMDAEIGRDSLIAEINGKVNGHRVVTMIPAEQISVFVIRERERIIKLLESRLLTTPQPNMENDTLGSFSHAMHNQMIRNMVALIKGENK